MTIRKLAPANALTVEVGELSTLENISANFDCFSRPDLYTEIILDCTCFDGDQERFLELCGILGVELDSDHAAELEAAGYVVFYC